MHLHRAVGRPPLERTRNRRGEGDRLRIDLLDAAAELLAEHGALEAVSLRAVARRVGVSATAVYRHFDDHDELMREAVAHCWQNFLEMLEDAERDGSDAFERFELSGLGYARFATERAGQYRVMFSTGIDVDDAGDTSSMAAATFQVLVGQVTEMLAALGDDRNPHLVAVQVHTWIHGIVDLIGCRPDMDWPPVVDQLDGLRSALSLTRPGA